MVLHFWILFKLFPKKLKKTEGHENEIKNPLLHTVNYLIDSRSDRLQTIPKDLNNRKCE